MTVTPQHFLDTAEGLAKHLLAMPKMLRDIRLRELQQQDRTMHAVVQRQIEHVLKFYK